MTTPHPRYPWALEICWDCWWGEGYFCWPHTLAWMWREQARDRRLGIVKTYEEEMTQETETLETKLWALAAEMVPCSDCKGDGCLNPIDPFIPCPKCDGSGEADAITGLTVPCKYRAYKTCPCTASDVEEFPSSHERGCRLCGLKWPLYQSWIAPHHISEHKDSCPCQGRGSVLAPEAAMGWALEEWLLSQPYVRYIELWPPVVLDSQHGIRVVHYDGRARIPSAQATRLHALVDAATKARKGE